MRIYILPILIGFGLIFIFNFCKKEETNIPIDFKSPILDPSLNYIHTSRFQGQVNPNEPLDNVLTNAKIALGRVLFYDPRLSKTSTVSCASCPAPATPSPADPGADKSSWRGNRGSAPRASAPPQQQSRPSKA